MEHNQDLNDFEDDASKLEYLFNEQRSKPLTQSYLKKF